jgi:flagellar biosynthesis/type III secretory pathway chaperone
MSHQRSSELLDSLDDLLEAERAALLTGDLDNVGRLFERKEALIEELSAIEDCEAQALQDLQGKMKRNQDLLNSALEGIRTVAGRLAALRRVRSSLETYDSKGTRRTIEVAKDGAVEKRA